MQIKLYLSVLFFITTLLSIKAQEGYSIKKEMLAYKKLLMENKLAACYSYEFKYENKKLSKDSMLSVVEQYDTLGNCTHTIWYNWDIKDKIDCEIYYKFDNRGNMTEENSTVDRVRWFCENYYDSIGNLIKVKWRDTKSEVKDILICDYDNHQNIIHEFFLNSDSVVRWKYLYSYDKNDNLIKRERYDSLNKLKETGLLYYNKKGQKIGFNEINPKSGMKRRLLHALPRYKYILWKYKDNKICKEIVKKDHLVIYFYNDKGLCIGDYWENYKKDPWVVNKSYYITRQ